MNLAARRSARQREDFVMRLGSVLVAMAVLASLVLEPPRAKAVVMASSAVSALASGFLAACGLTPVVSGMGSSEEVNESVARLLQDFLNEEVGGISVADWALSFGEIGLAVKDKKIVIPKPFAEKLGEFASWVASKYGTKAGMNQVYYTHDSYVTLQDGRTLYFSEMVFAGDGSEPTVSSFGSIFEASADLPIVFSSGSYIASPYVGSSGNHVIKFISSDSNVVINPSFYILPKFTFALYSNYMYLFWYYPDRDAWIFANWVNISNPSGAKYFPIDDVISADESLALDVAETITIPEGLTDGQSVALDVGATGSMSIQDILQGILDAILAGDLAASAEIVDEATEPVDPEEPDPPVVPVIPEGLDQLGAALTSRFPFSIPWDVYKGVTLLAAPPKAPYFEVDFLAPIADRVGGWKGSTKIVLDFSEYEIIGQVCRWTSTIGFCLMLAAGTKRLIWTA